MSDISLEAIETNSKSQVINVQRDDVGNKHFYVDSDSGLVCDYFMCYLSGLCVCERGLTDKKENQQTADD
jgi:hypothetical protein